jgi:hypothetical protein
MTDSTPRILEAADRPTPRRIWSQRGTSRRTGEQRCPTCGRSFADCFCDSTIKLSSAHAGQAGAKRGSIPLVGSPPRNLCNGVFEGGASAVLAADRESTRSVVKLLEVRNSVGAGINIPRRCATPARSPEKAAGKLAVGHLSGCADGNRRAAGIGDSGAASSISLEVRP